MSKKIRKKACKNITSVERIWEKWMQETTNKQGPHCACDSIGAKGLLGHGISISKIA